MMLVLWVNPTTEEVDGSRVDFATQVRPLLARNCFSCHGPDETERKGKLRLDTREGLLAPGELGAVVIAGVPESSRLFERVTSPHLDAKMPPPESGRSLSTSEVELLEQWIRQGAAYEEHWSFSPPRQHVAPSTEGRETHGKIDAFVYAELARRGIAPNDEEEPARLFRRLALDLTGLPPSPEEVLAFTRAEGAERDTLYESAVDRYLASPAHAERLARVFLDLFRHADTRGYEKDQRRDIWPFRDWLIRALDVDLPYPLFTERMLAGDLLPAPTEDDLVATAMHRNTMSNDEGGTDDEEFRIAAVKDRVDTTMQVWLGLTFGCAKCHTHKYDPISQVEYYRLMAFFDQTEDADRWDDAPTIEYLTPADRLHNAPLDEQLRKLRSDLKEKETALAGTSSADAIAKAPELEPLRQHIREIEASRKRPAALPILRELPHDRRRTTRVHVRGNFLDPGEVVIADTPAFLPAFPSHEPRNRLGLAHWLTSAENPLTARVLVNRIWALFFGRGIVETEEDFGRQGTPPTHRELLDDLAARFIDHGQSLDWLCREIVLSAAYRRASAANAEARAVDPRNDWLGRGPRNRLEAEAIRDQALAISGLLSDQRFGPPVMPRQPEGIWAVVYSGDQWITSAGDDAFRRSLYTFVRRTSAYPGLLTFDAPTRETCTVRRITTNTPLQSLVTLNDPVYVECAQALARGSMTASDSVDEIAREMFRRATAREAAPEELATLVELYSKRLGVYREDRPAALAMAQDPLGLLPPGVDPAEAAAWTNVANVVLNLDEVLSR